MCTVQKDFHFQWLSKDQCSNLELEKPDGIQNYLFQSRRELLRQQEVNELILQKGRDREVSWLLQLLLLECIGEFEYGQEAENLGKTQSHSWKGAASGKERNLKRFWWRIGKFQVHGSVFTTKTYPNTGAVCRRRQKHNWQASEEQNRALLSSSEHRD